MFGNQNSLRKNSSGNIIVFTRGTITVNGAEISEQEKERLKEDSARRLLTFFAARQEERERIRVIKSAETGKQKEVFKKTSNVKNKKQKI